LRASALRRRLDLVFAPQFDNKEHGKKLGLSARMARNPRDRICGGIYHIMNRGNRKMPIYVDHQDRRGFLKIMVEEAERYGVNHFHAAVMTPHGNLPEFMAQLQGRFARYSNWRHGNVGHLFQGRYRCVVIEHDIHLLTALCYIFFNPVSAGLVGKLEDYKWSTYAATVGLAPLPGYLTLDWLTSLFPGASLQEAQRQFHRLMGEAKPVASYLQGDFDVDADAVRRVFHSYVGENIQLGMLPRVYRSALRRPLSELIQERMTEPMRAPAIYDAHVIHGYKLAEIARELRLDRSTVSKIFRATFKSRTSSAA
jgi:putative transposase